MNKHTWLNAFGESSNTITSSSSRGEKAKIITFFSHRGGVGRSTTLANVAALLNSKGHNVVCIDGDLEAPSLDRIFDIENIESGFIDLIVKAEVDEITSKDILDSLNPVNDDGLFLIPAGKVDKEYIKSLRWIDTDTWYETEKSPFQKIVDALNSSPISPRFILIDARTGISNLNSPFLFFESDMIISLFIPNKYSLDGNSLLSQGIEKSKNYRNEKIDLRFVATMLPPNIDLRTAMLERAKDAVSQWIDDLSPLEEAFTTFNYNESVAANPLHNLKNDDRPYTIICDWITSSRSEDDILIYNEIEDKNEVIKDLISIVQKATGSAERDDYLRHYFVKNKQYDRIVDKSTSFVIGRKGTGKTTLFRHFVELHRAYVMAAPNLLSKDHKNSPTRVVYHKWRATHGNSVGSWRKFWLLQMLNATSTSTDILERFGSYDENSIAEVFIEDFMNAHSEDVIFAIDGLDDGFGSDTSDYETRHSAILGLLDFWFQYGTKFDKVHFKIFIREDLWSNAHVVNKSHFYGSTITLSWDHIDYLSVLTRLSSISQKFRRAYINAYSSSKTASDIDIELIDFKKAWRLIFGLRMDTGKSAFTESWVWKRLGDSNDDHNVRNLIHLYEISLNRSEALLNSTSIVNPRAVMNSLPDVSARAIEALREEYGEELNNTLNLLHIISNTPIEKDALSSLSKNEIQFAIDVGLISARSDGRYSVPDLYRYALKMNRRGRQ